MRTIKDNTDAYEETKRTESSGRVWKEITLDALRIWLGIVIHMGVHSSPAVADYWANDNLSPATSPAPTCLRHVLSR
jgi:hypothetical protein